jgi:predicted CoA-substrate-specific enzyme activase
VTEITCHARGVFREMGHGGTLIDIGGQDTKVIVIDNDGNVKNFAMNDKCAAGTGRFLEVVAERLRIPLAKMAEVALSTAEEASISSTCTVFTESEIVSLIARGSHTEHIVRGLHRSLVRRISALARTAGLTPPVMLSGGVAQNAAIREILSDETGHRVLRPVIPSSWAPTGPP